MTGDRPLWSLRRAGHRPTAAWVIDGDSVFARDWHRPPNCVPGAFLPEIEIAPEDVPEALDLRCLVGMTVYVYGMRGESRARRLHSAVIDAKAALVITSIGGQIGDELLIH